MQALGRQDMGLEALEQRHQRRARRRPPDRPASTGSAARPRGRSARPAGSAADAGRTSRTGSSPAGWGRPSRAGSTWNGAGAWLIVSQSRQVNFSRTCWITFHWRGMTSSVSVTSSPSLDSRVPPQQAQAVGAGSTTRSRGRCSGNGLRDGRLRVKAATFVVLAAASRRPARPRWRSLPVPPAAAPSDPAAARLRSERGPIALALQLLDLQLQMRDQRLVAGPFGLDAAATSARGRRSTPPSALRFVGQGVRARIHERMESQNRSDLRRPLMRRGAKFFTSIPPPSAARCAADFASRSPPA